MDFPAFVLDPPDVKRSTCIGHVFRGYRSIYYHNGTIGLRQGVKLLKRKSCPGCEQCGWLFDDIKESISCDSLIMPSEIENGVLYGIKVVNILRDWESGIAEDYDLELYKLED